MIDIWKKRNLIVSPVDGILTFSVVYNKNQYITNNQSIVTVIPLDRNSIIGKVSIPIVRSGKVKAGQKVNLKFNNYPYQEFGMINTSIPAFLSKRIGVDEQGSILGIAGSVASIANIPGALVIGLIYEITGSFVPFFISAIT